MVQFVAPPLHSNTIITECHTAGAKVMVTCNTLKEAVMAADAGVNSTNIYGTYVTLTIDRLLFASLCLLLCIIKMTWTPNVSL